MDQKTTIKEIAKICNVSPAVVSRVINQDPSLVVRPETRIKVQEKVRELNFIPNYMARGLRIKKSGMIGLMLVDFTNPYAGQLVRGAQEVLTNEGIFCITCENKEQRELSLKWVELFKERQIEGLIIATVEEEDPVVELLDKLNIKYVMASRAANNSKAPSVISDTYQGMSLALDHLIKLGHTRIAYIEGHLRTMPGDLRMKGYLDGLKNNNLPLKNEYIVHADYTAESGSRAMKKLLQCEEWPTAVVACSDAVAISALQALSESNIDVPQKISIIGFHNIPFSSTVKPPLTTIDTKTYEVGKRAAQLLIELMKEKEIIDAKEKIGVDLVVRESTAPI